MTSYSSADEKWKMAVAERLEQIFQLVGGTDYDSPEDEICPRCHHDKVEHTPHGCFHYDGSEEREYCACDETYQPSSSASLHVKGGSHSAHLSN